VLNSGEQSDRAFHAWRAESCNGAAAAYYTVEERGSPRRPGKHAVFWNGSPRVSPKRVRGAGGARCSAIGHGARSALLTHLTRTGLEVESSKLGSAWPKKSFSSMTRVPCG
jgi:hypothetical protein